MRSCQQLRIDHEIGFGLATLGARRRQTGHLTGERKCEREKKRALRARARTHVAAVSVSVAAAGSSVRPILPLPFFFAFGALLTDTSPGSGPCEAPEAACESADAPASSSSLPAMI